MTNKSSMIVRRDAAGKRPTKRTDWSRIDGLSDADIARSIAEDPDAAPLLDETWLAEATVVKARGRDRVEVQLDRDIVAWFRHDGSGYLDRINAVLRAWVEQKNTR